MFKDHNRRAIIDAVLEAFRRECLLIDLPPPEVAEDREQMRISNYGMEIRVQTLILAVL